MTLSRVDPLSAGKVLGCLYALLGLLFGAIVALFSLVAGAAAAGGGGNPLGAFGGGLAAVVTLPLFYGIAGFLGGCCQPFYTTSSPGWSGGSN